MSVFLCWSGDLSHRFAQALETLLLGSLPSLKTGDVFISDAIEKGANWFNSLERELERAHAGIVCLNAGNLGSPWLHFEAGALGNRLARLPKAPGDLQTSGHPISHRRLFTVLHGLPGAAVTGPLSAYQSTVTTQRDIGEMVLALARALGLPEADAAGRAGSLVPPHRWAAFERTVTRLTVLLRTVLDLDTLFDRKTFNEPIYRCTDQAWVRRYDGARETFARLDAEKHVAAACSAHERAVFALLRAELNGYAMDMQSLLLRPRRFELAERGELTIDPAIRTCCEGRRMAIGSLVTMLRHPLDEPLRADAIRFMAAETDAERKRIVHRLEGAVRRRREAVFERSRSGAFDWPALNEALRALTAGHAPSDYRASSWDLDRIYYYLLVKYFTTGALRWDASAARPGRRPRAGDLVDRPLDHDWLCAARDVELEVERCRAGAKGGSLIPLTYALEALRQLHADRAAHAGDVAATVRCALDRVDELLQGTQASDASRAIQQLVSSLRAPDPDSQARIPGLEAATSPARSARTHGVRTAPGAHTRRPTTSGHDRARAGARAPRRRPPA